MKQRVISKMNLERSCKAKIITDTKFLTLIDYLNFLCIETNLLFNKIYKCLLLKYRFHIFILKYIHLRYYNILEDSQF